MTFRKIFLLGAFVAATTVLTNGCSAAQVQYILGTPMLTDPFDNTRWYYVHFLRQGWKDPQVKTLVVQFQGRTLYDMAGDFKKPDAFYSGDMDVQKVNFAGQNYMVPNQNP